MSSFDTLQGQILRPMGKISLVPGQVWAHKTLPLPRSLMGHPLNQLNQSHPAPLGRSAHASPAPSTGLPRDEEAAIGSPGCWVFPQQMASPRG